MNNTYLKRKLLLCFLLVVVWFSSSFTLEGQNRWKSYYSYKSCFDLIETKDFIVGATDLGIILYHKETASISVRNKINGLSDSGISAIGYAEASDIIMLGYTNGNIDLIKKGRVFNIPDLKIENMIGSKQINHFRYHDGKVFCSTDFGIMQIDIDKNEISSTFIIGEQASLLKVYMTLVDGKFIYAATSNGILRAAIDDRALGFYENWDLYSVGASEYCDLGMTSQGLIAARGIPGGECDLMLIGDESSVLKRSFNNFRDLKVYQDDLLVTTRNMIFVLNSDFSTDVSIGSIDIGEESVYRPTYFSAIYSGNQNLWFADWNGGLVYGIPEGRFEQILPPGPHSNLVFRSKKIGDELWIVPGGFGLIYNNGFIAPAVSILKDDKWIFFDRSNTPEFTSSVWDLINIEVHPHNPDNVYISSWGNGVFEFDKENDTIFLKNHYLEENSGLQNVPGNPKDRYTRIWGLVFDEDGNLFMTNSDVEKTVVAYSTSDSAWHQYDYGIFLVNHDDKPGEIFIDNQGYKWINMVHSDVKGLLVFDDNGTVLNSSDDRYRGAYPASQDRDSRNAGLLELWDENGEVLTNNIYSITNDNNGYMWFGTDIGVFVQYNPFNIFNDPKPVFSRIKVPRDDGSGLADYLLEDQKVMSIAVDGANRKYFGTDGTGVYIVSEDGTRTVNHFTTSNSPLPSNSIIHIDIDEVSGEVFIATDKGLISYMGDAVKGSKEFSDVYVYPNPVAPGYEGQITITGLVDRANVKITDTAGNLVYETISLGGKALWNGKNLLGKKVKPGVYIVFLASPDGVQSEFTKIAILR